jgi:very-short-patch-repair endonuclease
MDWRDVARSQAGVITRDQLADCALPLGAIRRLVAQHDLVALLPGVYTARPVPDSFQQRAWAAALWSGGAISHRSAAPFWRVPVERSARIHVTVDADLRRTAPGLVLHRIACPGRSTTIDGLPVTTRQTTVLDLLRTESRGAARTLLDRALQQRWIAPDDLRRELLDHPGRTGNKQLRALIGDIEPGADAESERILHRRLRAAKIGGWQAQYRVRLTSSVVYLDLAFPEHRVAIEVDGRRYHDARSEAFESDRRKQNELQLRGWLVLRFTWAALRDDPDGVIAMIVATLGERSRQSGAL